MQQIQLSLFFKIPEQMVLQQQQCYERKGFKHGSGSEDVDFPQPNEMNHPLTPTSHDVNMEVCKSMQLQSKEVCISTVQLIPLVCILIAVISASLLDDSNQFKEIWDKNLNFRMWQKLTVSLSTTEHTVGYEHQDQHVHQCKLQMIISLAAPINLVQVN